MQKAGSIGFTHRPFALHVSMDRRVMPGGDEVIKRLLTDSGASAPRELMSLVTSSVA
jgi:hypothetical protein